MVLPSRTIGGISIWPEDQQLNTKHSMLSPELLGDLRSSSLDLRIFAVFFVNLPDGAPNPLRKQLQDRIGWCCSALAQAKTRISLATWTVLALEMVSKILEWYWTCVGFFCHQMGFFRPISTVKSRPQVARVRELRKSQKVRYKERPMTRGVLRLLSFFLGGEFFPLERWSGLLKPIFLKRNGGNNDPIIILNPPTQQKKTHTIPTWLSWWPGLFFSN